MPTAAHLAPVAAGPARKRAAPSLRPGCSQALPGRAGHRGGMDADRRTGLDAALLLAALAVVLLTLTPTGGSGWEWAHP